MPAVSVLLPCYNATTTLEQALESLASQTFTDFEVVAIDDGSTDSTAEILQRWSREDTRFNIYSQPHGGIITALNLGLHKSNANYIARMDADDLCHPERLERQVDYLEAHPEVSLVGCRVAGYPPDSLRRGFNIYIDWQNALVSDADIRREIFIESPLAHPSVTFRKNWVERAGGYQEHGWPEDYDLWLRLYLLGAQFAKVPEVLVYWRDKGERLTRTDRRYSLENFLRAKAHYLARGPLIGREAVIIWGAGMVGRRLSKHLERQGIPLSAFIDIAPGKIGGSLRRLPILSPAQLPGLWQRLDQPVLLAAVAARGARALIRVHLSDLSLVEGQDWWSVA